MNDVGKEWQQVLLRFILQRFMTLRYVSRNDVVKHAGL